jgi:hypothetical protein
VGRFELDEPGNLKKLSEIGEVRLFSTGNPTEFKGGRNFPLGKLNRVSQTIHTRTASC